MAVYLPCYKFLQTCMVVLLTGSYVGTTIIATHACRAASVQLFDFAQVGCGNTAWSLYKKNALNIVWGVNATATFVNGNNDKFFRDKSRNIWILDIQDFDEAIYSIRCQVGNTTKQYEVKLNVLVEPETRCKPKIVRGVDTLTAYLEPDGCGKPAASAYWMEQPGISVDNNVIKLQPGEEAGTVYACINSPALRCAKNTNLSDYCTVFKDESGIQPILSGIFGITGANLIVTTITTVLIVCLIMTAIVFQRRQMSMLKKNVQWKHLSALQKRNQLSEEGLQLLDNSEKAYSTPPNIYDKEYDIEKATTENPCRSYERNTETA